MEETQKRIANVGQVVKWVNELAPFELAEEWDNVGLLAGHPDNAADRILCALDLNESILDEAIECGAQVIVTHHPILFRGRKNLCETDSEGHLLCRLIRSNIALIAAHTNFDNAHPGVNDMLALKVGIQNPLALGNGLCVGDVEETCLQAFVKKVSERLGDVVRVYGRADTTIRRAAVLGGSGGDFAREARIAGADVFITGEISYHLAEACAAEGLCVLEAGHAATEIPAVSLLTDALQKKADDVEYSIRVIKSRRMAF